MALQIEGGFGNRTPLDIDLKGRAQVVAVLHSALFDHSLFDGEAFSWASGTYDYDAGDTILLIKNISSKKLHIEDIALSGDADTRVVIHFPSNLEVFPEGTEIIGTNMNTLFSNAAAAQSAQDETDNTQGAIIWSGEIHANQSPFVLNYQGGLIVSETRSLAIDYVSAGSACDVVVSGFYR